MTSPVPASIPADGNLRSAWVPALADPANPTLAELNAAGAVDLSCYLSGGGYTPGVDEQAIVDERVCSRQTFEQPGRVQDTLTIGYVYRPQEPVSATNKAFTTLKHLTSGYIVERWGQAYEDAWAAGQIVDVKPAKCGVQMKQPPESNSVLRVNQKIFIVGKVERDVAVVA